LQGFAEVGVQLHLWDRNQGAIAAEGAGVAAAREEVRRVELELRNRFAMYKEDYLSSRLIADKYRVEILPRLERAYKLMIEQYGLMTASFIRVLILERMLYENETAYVDALERSWTSSIALRRFCSKDHSTRRIQKAPPLQTTVATPGSRSAKEPTCSVRLLGLGSNKGRNSSRVGRARRSIPIQWFRQGKKSGQAV